MNPYIAEYIEEIEAWVQECEEDEENCNQCPFGCSLCNEECEQLFPGFSSPYWVLEQDSHSNMSWRLRDDCPCDYYGTEYVLKAAKGFLEEYRRSMK